MGEKETSRDNESLPALVSRLGDNLVTLLDTKLTLLKIELKEDVKGYVRSGLSIGLGGVLTLIGFALLNIALAFLASTLFESMQLSQTVKYALGFILTGALYLIVGVIVIVSTKKRLAKQNLTPEKSVQEIEKDRQWLGREL